MGAKSSEEKEPRHTTGSSDERGRTEPPKPSSQSQGKSAVNKETGTSGGQNTSPRGPKSDKGTGKTESASSGTSSSKTAQKPDGAPGGQNTSVRAPKLDKNSTTATPSAPKAQGSAPSRDNASPSTKGAKAPAGEAAQKSSSTAASTKSASSSSPAKSASASSISKGGDIKTAALAGATDAAVDKTLKGDPNSKKNRYAKSAARGGAQGALTGGGAPGAAAGAVKEVGREAASDVTGGARLPLGGLDGGNKDKDKDKDKGGDGSKDDPAGDEDAERTLGAGGTGYVTDPNDPDGEQAKRKRNLKRMAAVGAVANVAPPAMLLIFLMTLLALLKNMFFQMMAALMATLQMLMEFLKALVIAVLKVVFAPLLALGSLVSSAASVVFGAGSALASAGAGLISATAVVAVGLTGVTGGVINTVNNNAGSEGGNQPGSTCRVVNTGGGPALPIGETEEANAKVVYAVLSDMGMPDENIAGILGNWSRESRVDPTSVQHIFDEPYEYGPQKRSAVESKDTSLGLGLGQWTGARHTLLVEYAEAKDRDWYDLGLQLTFMADGDNTSDVAVFKDMIANAQPSPGVAAEYFHHKWERSADGPEGIAARAAAAESWYGRMSGWDVNESVVEKILGGLLTGIDNLVNGTLNRNTDGCGDDGGGGGGGKVKLRDGGMNEAEAEKLIALYNEEGDKYLDDKYGPGGGPGSCGDNHAMNCVSFSTYFLNKYTTFDQYAQGNGVDTAARLAEMTGKELSKTPTPYSIGSGPSSTPAGHTFAVLGVEGDKIIIGEAGYCAFMGRVRVADVSEFQNWVFVDMSDELKDGKDPKAEVEG